LKVQRGGELLKGTRVIGGKGGVGGRKIEIELKSFERTYESVWVVWHGKQHKGNEV